MMKPLYVALIACIAGCLCYFSALAATWATSVLPRMRERPAREPRPITLLLVPLVGALVASLYATRESTPIAFVRLGLVLVSLAFAVTADLRVGTVPVAVMAPLIALTAAIEIATHQTASVLAACVVLVPFAFASAWTRGRGLGAGDVQIAALGALALSPILGMIAFAGACFGAAGVTLARRSESRRLTFSPYLATTIAVSLALPMLVF